MCSQAMNLQLFQLYVHTISGCNKHLCAVDMVGGSERQESRRRRPYRATGEEALGGEGKFVG